MRFLALADIHQAEEKWEQLVRAVHEKRPDYVLIAGDLLPKENGILGQLKYLPFLRDYALEIKACGSKLVVIPGNDDNQLAVLKFEEWDRSGTWHYLSDRVKRIGNLTFCGCPWIRDYPFAYKYWVAPEKPGEPGMCDLQLGPPLLINKRNEIEEIKDFTAYLEGKESIKESLERLACSAGDLSASIWLIHEPPAGMSFDLCATGERVGSPVVYDFLSRFQPLLSLHGHIHEAPKYNGGVWAGKIGRTVCFQPGQLDDGLYYITFELKRDSVINPLHSVYGSGRLLI